MATPRPTRRPDLEVHLGASGQIVGRLHLGSGRRSAFSYDEGWLRDARFFTLSPDLQPVAGVQHSRQVFFLALEDTAPDAWGERVIRRAHAKLRQEDRDTPALDPVDFVMWVNDEARVGALRLFDPQSGAYLRTGGANRHVPPLVELEKVLHAARALEDGTESAQDLRYLLGQGTSLGGARPKSTVRDTDGLCKPAKSLPPWACSSTRKAAGLSRLSAMPVATGVRLRRRFIICLKPATARIGTVCATPRKCGISMRATRCCCGYGTANTAVTSRSAQTWPVANGLRRWCRQAAGSLRGPWAAIRWWAAPWRRGLSSPVSKWRLPTGTRRRPDFPRSCGMRLQGRQLRGPAFHQPCKHAAGIAPRPVFQEIGEVFLGAWVGVVRNDAHHGVRNAGFVAHLGHGGAFHFHAKYIRQPAMDIGAGAGVADEYVAGGDCAPVCLGPARACGNCCIACAKRRQIAFRMFLQQLAQCGVGREVGAAQQGHFVAGKQGPGVQVVLHEAAGYDD